jgi:DNA-binding CsgD family transcriptional regulator
VGLPRDLFAPLVGRAAELARLRGLLEADGARVAEVIGDPGIGKTRLLLEFAAIAERSGRVVLWGRAAEFERHVPFGAVTDALEDHLVTAGPDIVAGLGAGDVALLRALFPALPGPDSDAAPRELIEAERYRLHRAVRALLEVLAARVGLVLIVDDLHWADDGSAELLDHLLRHPPRGPVLLAVAHRPRQTPGRLQHAFARALQDGLAELIEVSTLSPAEADALLPAGLSTARRRDLYTASDGNPFYLQALARGSAANAAIPSHSDSHGGAIPAPVQAALAGELASLTGTELLVARAAAVVGEGVEADLIAQAAGLGLDEVLAALDELADRDLLRPDLAGGSVRFRHPLVRSATYESVAAGWRIAAHARAAAALRDRGAPAADMAHHVERSARRGDLDAVGLLREAAAATMHSAPATAAHWLQAALRLLPDDATSLLARLEMLGMRAKALGVTGRLRESRDALHELLRLLPAEFAEQRVQIVAFAAMIERLIGRHMEARASLLAELAGLADQHGPAALALKLGLANGVVMRQDRDADQDWPGEALATARRNANRALQAAALGMCVAAHHQAGTVDERTTAWLGEAAALVDALPDGELAQGLQAIMWLGVSEICAEHLDDAIRHIGRALRLARTTGQNHVIAQLHGMHGWAHTLLGNLSTAAECFDDELDAAVLTASPALRGMALEHQCWIATWRGDLEEALQLGKEAVACAEDGEYLNLGTATLVLAQAHLYNGDAATCVDLIVEAGGGPELPAVDPSSRTSWYQVLAVADASRGHTVDAAMWADSAELAAHRPGLSRPTAIAQLARAYALAPADPSAAIPYADKAAESSTRAGNRVDAGRAHLLAGTAFAAVGDTDRARERFAQARALFEVCGARLFLDLTIREERRMNARRPRRTSRRTEHPAAPELTPRELQIAELVGQGLTNREIAEKLYLSPKTVDVHLGRVYAKLGVSRRAAVAGRLARLGPGHGGPSTNVPPSDQQGSRA